MAPPGGADEAGTMELWVLIPITIACVALVFFMRGKLVRRALECPHRKTYAVVDVLQPFQDVTERPRVKACSLLPDRERVDCDQACLTQAS